MKGIEIHKNKDRIMAIELQSRSLISFSIDWLGSESKAINFNVNRKNEDLKFEKWKPLQFLIGDSITLIIDNVNQVDPPNQILSINDIDNLLNLSCWEPGNLANRKLGEFELKINGQTYFSFPLTNSNILQISFLWIGGNKGKSLLDIKLDGQLIPLKKIPKIQFGGMLTFSTGLTAVPT